MTRARARLAGVLAIAALVVLPAVATAHPLGNFTINHYAGVWVEPDRVVLDVVIDQAEIPTFQNRLAFDTDDDGSVSDAEAAAGRIEACATLAGELALTADGAPLPLRAIAAGLSFPLGTTGLATMRVVCGFEATLPVPLADGTATEIGFRDTSYEERLGWREIVVTGSGATARVTDGSARVDGLSDRLTAYPEDLLSQPLDDGWVTLAATAGGPVLPPPVWPDATPLDAADPAAPGDPAPGDPAPVDPGTAAVPGGVAGEIPAIFATTNVTPVVLVLALLTAAALGAGHALTPGHGKTLMAAYLVGTRGTPLHAIGLGLSVSVSHTVGILVLAAVVVGAADVLSPDVIVRVAPVIAAISILAIGGWMLLGELRRRRARVVAKRAHAAAHAHGEAHEHEHEHDHAHGHDHAHADDHGHDHDHDPLEHAHGGITHRHAPPAGTTITWRGLFALGLAGGLIPSTSALLILLGAIAAGRPTYGFVLVLAFGIGMAAVMGGIGLAMVFARERLDALPAGGGIGRIRTAVPLAAAVLVFGFGIYLTIQAIGGSTVL